MRTRSRTFQRILRGAVSVLASGALWAQVPQKLTPTPSAPSAPAGVAEETQTTTAEERHELTAADLGTFLDGFMPQQLHRENIAGAVVLVVKDGKVLFANGYGFLMSTLLLTAAATTGSPLISSREFR